MDDDRLAEAVASLAHIKAEHRDLLLTIAADAGMEPSTRQALIAHVLEEEDEKVATISALLGDRSGGATTATSSGTRAGRGLTVGSLRGERAFDGPAPSTLGNLRQERR